MTRLTKKSFMVLVFLVSVLVAGCGPSLPPEDKPEFSGIKFRNNGTDGYLFGFNKGQFEKVTLWNLSDGVWSEVKSSGTQYNPYEWHELLIVVNGSHFKGYVDGNLELTYDSLVEDDKNNTGLGTELLNAEFDDFYVYNFTNDNYNTATDFLANLNNRTYSIFFNSSNMQVGYHDFRVVLPHDPFTLNTSTANPFIASVNLVFLNESNSTQGLYNIVCLPNGSYETHNSGGYGNMTYDASCDYGGIGYGYDPGRGTGS